MKNPIGKGIALNIVWVIILFALTYAFGEDRIRLQGIIMELNMKTNMMIVNERLFVWDEKTIMNNDKGSPITIDKFKPKSWVYIEGDRDKIKTDKRIMIKKIYLLPKRIGKNERDLYPFIE